MKIDYIKNPPLQKVIIEFHFPNDFALKISDASKISEALEGKYNNEPNIFLLPQITPGQEVKFPMGGNLRYSSNDNSKIINIGRNFLIFTFTKYENWELLSGQLIEILIKLHEALEIIDISKVKITYVDEFRIEKEDFKFIENFQIDIKLPGDWGLFFHDFYLGIVPFENDYKKMVLRLKGLGISEDNKYIFSLETLFISKNLEMKIEKEKITSYLNEAHELIEIYFIDLLNQTKLKEKIGMYLENE